MIVIELGIKLLSLGFFLVQGFHPLGDKSRTVDQAFILRIFLIEGFHLFSDSDRTRN